MENKTKYAGKELQSKEFSDGSGLEWSDLGARMYDGQIGRFFNHDRYADSYVSFNPYQYTANNPINFSDYNGDYITIDRKDDKGTVLLSLLYEDNKAYFYTKDKDNNIIKGDAWSGTDNFITQAVTDLGEISSTKQGKTVVADLQGSKFGYSISGVNDIKNSSFYGKDGTKGGGDISYYQKGGSHVNAKINRSSVVLGHELYHGWAFEFSYEPKTMDFGARLLRETNGVKFENYLRASFGESVMRTHYRLNSNDEKVASSSIDEALNYQLPPANYYKFVRPERKVPAQADNTIDRRPIKIEPIDTRKTKF